MVAFGQIAQEGLHCEHFKYFFHKKNNMFEKERLNNNKKGHQICFILIKNLYKI